MKNIVFVLLFLWHQEKSQFPQIVLEFILNDYTRYVI